MKRTILIVDDQSINRRILDKLLRDEYNIMTAENGQAALEILHSNSDVISAVLLDIVMPVMDGYDVLREMKANPALSKIPVIVSSQKDGDEAEVKALSLGAMDFIAKPYKADIIRHRLANTIEFRETAAMINKAERDELTGLYNKQFFMEKVREELDKNPDKKYDLICLGIEKFKLVNDTFGPAKGDELLKFMGSVMSESDGGMNISGRFMADLFFTLVEHNDHYTNEAFKRFEEIINQFPIDIDIKINCGIYEIGNLSNPISVMCDRAQLAAEKNKGKYDAYFTLYDDSLRQQLLKEQFITSTMQTALEQHQFIVYYQPKYDLNNEHVAGAEALVRWIHPERGFMSPGEFIPIFEKNGFITQLDQYVWEKACRDIRSWIDKGFPTVSISVNVSRADIYNPKLVDILLGLIAKYNIPIHYLHLEITESAYTDNPDQIIQVVNRMRDVGFVVEMDDFGSGYSSLNMLAEMPVDILKLDMRFMQSEANYASGKGILSFVISLAKWLNLAVVAEGVETADQIITLRSMDCNYVQGFYFARPMCLEDFETLLTSSNTVEMICNSQTVRQFVDKSETDRTRAASDKVILVVDDIEINRAVLVSMFDTEYNVVEMENGKTAWDYLVEHHKEVELVMLDLLMPVMDGFQLLERIRDNEEMHDLPVIITSQGDKDSEERALGMEADDFISKPYNPAIIKHRVNNVLASHRLIQIETGNMEALSPKEKLYAKVDALKDDFDLVRLVDPEHTLVCDAALNRECDLHSCFSVWGKTTRCSNCISLRALKERGRCSKLEYSESGLYFVISEYVPSEEGGAVIEMVTKLDDEYVDNVFDKNLLYLKLNALTDELDRDALTGVFNRRHIQKNLGQYLVWAKNSKKDFGIAMIDVDAFKQLNDAYGHLAGDEALKAVARLLESNIALSKGDFVARFGGDEFMVVCRDIQPEIFARRIRSVTEIVKHIDLEQGEPVSIRISAGCVNYSEFPEADINELIRQADKRLYASKHAKQETEQA